MPGNYTHPTRVTGTVVTQTIYNGDHQNHIDHMEPQYIDDASVNLTAMRAVASAGGVGTENLPISLQDELRQLRNALLEIRGTTYWYEAERTISVTIPTFFFLSGTVTAHSPIWSTGENVRALAECRLGSSWINNEDVTFAMRLMLQDNVTGTAFFTYTITRVRVGSANSTVNSGTISIVNPTFNVPFLQTIDTTSGASLQEGDILEVNINRDGGVGSDTLNGWLRHYDITAQFLAVASRT